MKLETLKQHLAMMLAANRQKFVDGTATEKDIQVGIMLLRFTEKSSLIDRDDKELETLMEKECKRLGLEWPPQTVDYDKFALN